MKIRIEKASCWVDTKLPNHRDLKPLDLYIEDHFCYTDKFNSIGEAVDWMLKNVHPRLIVEIDDEEAGITIYDSYVE